MSPFELATAIRATEDGRIYAAEIPDRWQQGKGAFGGVVIGILARAILAAEPEHARAFSFEGFHPSSSPRALTPLRNVRALRSLSADLCAPAMPGPVEVQVASLRRGGSVSFVDAQMFQEGALIARASAALAAARSLPASAIHGVPPRIPLPKRAPWNDIAPVPVAPPAGPVFAQHYEYRSTGRLPFIGGNEPTTEGWIREKNTPSTIDEAGIIGLLDAWWPTVFSVDVGPRGVATVGYTMQLVVDPRTLDPAEPLFYRAHGMGGGDNFFIEMRELWLGSTLVASNQQTFALLT